MIQTAEDVSFAANGITAAGIKAFDGVLQSNIALKTLNLSGNPIGDEGAKVSDRNVTSFFRKFNSNYIRKLSEQGT